MGGVNSLGRPPEWLLALLLFWESRVDSLCKREQLNHNLKIVIGVILETRARFNIPMPNHSLLTGLRRDLARSRLSLPRRPKKR